MRNITVRGASCWDPNVLNASSTNCNSLPVREQNDEMVIEKRDIENPNEYLGIINFGDDHIIQASTQQNRILFN